MPRSGVGEGRADRVGVGRGDEGDELRQGLPHSVEEADRFEPEVLGEGEGDAAGRGVEVGVNGVVRDARLRQPVREPAHEVRRDEPFQRLEEERVVRHDEVRAHRLGLVHDGGREVERDEHRLYPPVRVADLQANGVVRQFGAGRCPRFEGGGEFSDGHRGRALRGGRRGPKTTPGSRHASPDRPESRMPSASSTRVRKTAPMANKTITTETPTRCEPNTSVSTPSRSGPMNAVALPENAKNP